MLFTREFTKRIVFGYIPKKEEAKGYTIMHFFASDPRVLTKNIKSLKLKKILTLVDGGFNLDKISDIEKYVAIINKDIDILVVETNKQKKLAESINVDIPIKIIPFGVDTNKFKPTTIPPKPLKLLFASSPIKKNQLSSRGIDIMLSAFANVQKDIRLTFVTREGLSTKVKELISKNKIDDRVDLLSGNQKMSDLFAQHHACIIPYSSPYGVMDLPHTALESLASGRPVISTDVIGLSEILKEYKCGIICLATIEGLIKAIFQLTINYNNLQKNCRKTAEQYFNVERFIKEYTKLYMGVING